MTQSAQKLQQFRSKAYQLLGRAQDATFDLMDAVESEKFRGRWGTQRDKITKCPLFPNPLSTN